MAKSQPLNIFRLGRVVEADVLSGKVLSVSTEHSSAAPLREDTTAATLGAEAQSALRGLDNFNGTVTEENNEDGEDEQGPAPSQKNAISVLADPCIYNTPKIRKACIPSANGHFSARALAKMYAALAGGGSLDDAELLSSPIAAKVRGAILSV